MYLTLSINCDVAINAKELHLQSNWYLAARSDHEPSNRLSGMPAPLAQWQTFTAAAAAAAAQLATDAVHAVDAGSATSSNIALLEELAWSSHDSRARMKLTPQSISVARSPVKAESHDPRARMKLTPQCISVARSHDPRARMKLTPPWALKELLEGDFDGTLKSCHRERYDSAAWRHLDR